MAQNKRAFDEVRIPFSKMTYSPDVPSSALGPNEYNSGLNVETDIRGIRSAAGDEIILKNVPGTPTYVTGGYRRPQGGQDNDFWFIVATNEGKWWASNGGEWQDITPGGIASVGPYTQAQNITEAWNGTVPFFNDELNPPMFWPEFTGASFATTGASSSAGTSTITFATQNDTLEGVTILNQNGQFGYSGSTPLRVGQRIDISGTNTNTSGFRIQDVEIVNDEGVFSCANVGAPAEFTATINDGTPPGAGTVLTVSAVASGYIYNGMELTGTGIAAGTKIVGYVSGLANGPSVWTVNTSQEVASTNMIGQRTSGLYNGQSVIVSGTNTATPTTLTNVRILNDDGNFQCDSTSIQNGQSVTISGTITNTPETLTSVFIDDITGTFSCAATSGTLYEGQSVEVSGTVSATPTTLTGVYIDSPNASFSCGATTLRVGQVVTISGVNTNTGNQNLANVQITGTAGEFSCNAATLRVGQTVTIAGTNGGTGTITGYVNPTTYLVSATNGSTTFTLTLPNGNPIVTTAGTTTGLGVTVLSPQITSYTNPKSYVIIATNGTTTFSLANLDGTPVATRGGIPQNLTFTVEATEITGYSDPTTYVISATNGSTEFTLVEKTTGAPLETRGGDCSGLTLTVLIPAITDYTNPTTYYVRLTNGSTTFQLETATGVLLETQGGVPTGLTFTILASTINGYSNPTTYYISNTNGATLFTLVDNNGDPLVTQGGPVAGLQFRPQAPSITGYSTPSTYYIINTDGSSVFSLSTTPGGSAIATNAGTPVGLTYTYSPFAIGQEIIVENIVPTGFRGTHTVTGVSMSSVSFAGSTAGPQTRIGSVSDTQPYLILYANAVPLSLTNITTDPLNTDYQVITLAEEQVAPPYNGGEQIVISDVNNYFDGTYTVVSSTTTTITYKAIPGANYPSDTEGSVASLYTWNYNPNWQGLYAKFLRIYNTPNVGSILVAGGLTVTTLDGTVEEYPVTVRWSQAFGLNQAPKTWQPTITNVANELEVPLRGAVVDAFPCNGQLFLQSVWDTVVFSPINYATTSAPILGVRLMNQGRGMLSSNCWANTDKLVYGIDSRDIWVFNGQDFQGLGNQRVKNWLLNQIDPLYVDRVFMQTNTQKNQVEIYYPTRPPVIGSISILDTAGTFSCELIPTLDGGPLRLGLQVVLSGTETGSGSISGYSGGPTTYYVVDTNGVDEFTLSTTVDGNGVTTTPGTVTGVDFTFVSDGVPNMMVAYRHDLDCFNAPREIQAATMACEAPYWSSLKWYYNVASTTLTGSGTGARFDILRTNTFYDGTATPNVRGSGYAVGDTVKVLGTALGGETPANDATLTVTAVDSGGRIAEFTAAGEPLDDWTYNAGQRTVVYARGLANRTLVQKDDGYNFLGPQTREYPINSVFRRDNIKMLPDYSGKLLVHRILPEVENLNKFNLPIDPAQETNRIGSVNIRVEGANSVGQAPLETTAETMATNTDYPWVQISQNAHRVNTLEISNSSTENIWICNSATWQYTQTEDDR